MPVFKYVATDPFNNTVKSTYEAFSEQEVQIYLRRNNLTPVRISKSWLKADISFGKSVKQKDLIVFVRMFSAMVKAAVPLDQSLKVLYEQTENSALKRAIQRMIVDVESGESLSDSMKNQPAVFDTLFTNMIAAGEASGNMDTLLDRLAEVMEKTEAIRSKVKSAMVYPIILSLVSIGSVALLLTFVLPQFMELFEGSGVPLPLPTRMTMGASEFLQAYWMYLLGVSVGGSILFKRALKNDNVRRVRDRILLRLKVLGPIVTKGAVARFSRTLATLVASGVSLLDGLDLTAETTGNLVLTESLYEARTAISTGAEIAPTLKASGYFPPLMTSMVSIGEQSGEVDTMLEKVAEFYEADVEQSVDSALKLIEPLMLVVMGSVIGIIMASIYLPMFDMIANIGG